MSLRRLLVIASIPTLAFAWVVLQYAQLDGERTVSWHAGERSPFINAPLPADRVEVVGEGVRLEADPVYFHVTPPPGRWQTVTVAADMRVGAQQTVELGTVVDARTNALDMRPAYQAVLAALPVDVWEKATVNGILTATRRGSTPTRLTTRAYRAPSPVYPAQRWSTGAPRTLPVALQGGHEWWTYGQAGDVLHWSAEVVDQNLVEGTDDLAVILQSATNEEIARVTLPDSTTGEERTLALTATLPETGAYRLVLSSTSDITWQSVTTNATHLVAKNQLRFAAQSTAPVWTTAAIVAREEPLGKQAVGLGEGEHELNDLAPGAAVIGDGWFALTESDLWSPTLTPLTSATRLANIDQLIVAEPSFTQTFSFARLQREANGSFRVILSLPGVSNVPADDQPVLRSLTITFSK